MTVPSDFQMSAEAKNLLNALKSRDLEQQTTCSRGKSREAPGAEGKQADQSLSWEPPHPRTPAPPHPRTSAQKPPHSLTPHLF
ncbi:MAG: hypothetical protein BRC54_03900 [Cyanobacteria bacterium SW_7_48_12]|nr:MAG: hypothetical protein BRC54_03900 [Cyanobacteria bacterium SW_7_48_12]